MRLVGYLKRSVYIRIYIYIYIYIYIFTVVYIFKWVRDLTPTTKAS